MFKKFYHFIRKSFYFSQTETNGFLILIGILTAVCVIPYPDSHSGEITDLKDKRMLDSLENTWNNLTEKKERKEIIEMKAMVLFKPDTVSLIQWLNMGCEQKVAQRIVNYQAKGGKFLCKKDMKKVFGLTETFFQKINPFLNLPDSVSWDKNNFVINKRKINFDSLKPKHTPFEFFGNKAYKPKLWKEINSADSLDLISIYGIGEKLSLKIINYRKRLGGFIRLEQLKEVRGIDSTNFTEITKHFFISDSMLLNKLNINTASVLELGKHPYIGFQHANHIIAYREQHGKFNCVEDVLKIRTITKDDLEKMREYLRAE